VSEAARLSSIDRDPDRADGRNQPEREHDADVPGGVTPESAKRSPDKTRAKETAGHDFLRPNRLNSILM